MMKKIFDNLSDVFRDTANRKRTAALARFQGIDLTVEPSRQVFIQSCEKIAIPFQERGFRFAKSGPHLARKAASFVYRICFSSSHNNIPGQHVALWMYANVLNRHLAEWRKSQAHPYRDDDWVAGGMVHLLDGRHKFIEWELVNREGRDAVISDIVNHINEVVLPYFAEFEEPGKTIESLVQGRIRAIDPATAVEFTLCFGGRLEAQAVLDTFINNHQELLPAIGQAVSRFREEGFPKWHVTAYAEQVAWMRAAYGLN